MSDTLDSAAFRRRLLALQAAHGAAAARRPAAAESVELDPTRIGRLTRVDALQAEALTASIRERAELQRVRIAAALQRLDEGRFGVCLRCEEPIGTGRLEADPTATLCIECARG